QVAMTVCSACGQGYQQGRGKSIAISNDVLEMALCDAQHIGGTHAHVGGEKRKRAKQSIPPATRREVMRRDGGRWVVPGCRGAGLLGARHCDTLAEGGDHNPDLLVLLCGKHHRLLHRGTLIIEGSISTGLRFYHADGPGDGTRAPDPA